MIMLFSSPFLGTFFQLNSNVSIGDGKGVFVPFLGDFLSIRRACTPLSMERLKGFRPLSWGLSFNREFVQECVACTVVFVPFLGDFLSIGTQRTD